ncbi:MAG: hypothetical protein CFE26_12920 [Verrucomicrobiales bacterium VVV1]|nr:MAG: hypothetical protein CFE26_12920 [Verrucomicrobiales bacterium VVV1]
MERSLTDSLVGKWLVSNMPIGSEDGLLVITPERQVVQFPTSVTLPRMNETMRLWICDDVADHVRFRLSKSGISWQRRVEFSADGWTMIANDHGQEIRFPCRPASHALLPPWFDDLLAKNLLLITELETNQAEESHELPL